RAERVSAESVERRQTHAHEYGDEHWRRGGAPPTDPRLGPRQIWKDPVVAMAGRDDARQGREPRGGGCGLEHTRALSSGRGRRASQPRTAGGQELVEDGAGERRGTRCA